MEKEGNSPVKHNVININLNKQHNNNNDDLTIDDLQKKKRIAI